MARSDETSPWWAALLVFALVACDTAGTEGGGDTAGGSADAAADVASDSGTTGDTAAPVDVPGAPDGRVDTSCEPGFSGPDCSHCTWSTAGEACHPVSPRDLFDIEAIRGLTLAELGWQPTGTETFDDVTVVKGSFSGGSFDAYTASGEQKTIELHYVAAVYVPDGWPRPDDPPLAYVAAVHYETNLIQPIAVAIARYFRIPVLHHGELARDWIALDFASRKELNQSTFPNQITNNPCEPVDLVRGNFGWAMAQADLRAITLTQRLAEEAGGQVDAVAFRGFSKEGLAGWLAVVVDPRIEVAAIGGYQAEHQLAAAEIALASWGCFGDPATADPTGPETAGIRLDWLRNTPAGAASLNAFDVHHNKSLIYPRFLLIDGDVGMSGMHDELYALGIETPFLDDFQEVPWRYVRKSGVTSGATDEDGDEVSKAVVPGLLVENLIGGAGSEDAVYPKVLSATAALAGDVLTVEATASAPTESMALIWSWSDDRVWKDPEQAPWAEVPMTKGVDGRWTSPAVDVEPGKVVGWYVEARNTVLIGATERMRTDAGAVHFLRETAPGTCSTAIPDWCGTGALP